MGDKAISQNPATEEILAEHIFESKDEALEKIKNLKQSFLMWREKSIDEKAEVILKVARDLRENKKSYADLIASEMGKPISQAESEVEKCAYACEYFAQNAKKFLEPEFVKIDFADEAYVEFDPLGVILAIMPWNFPFWQVIRCAVPAVLAGNVVALKHSPNTFLCAKKIEEIFSKYSDGILINLFIKEEDVKFIIPEVQGVSLTGSVRAGQAVGELAGKNIKPVVLELGGSDPFIVFDDADFEVAVETAVRARIINSGQSCISAKRFIIHEKIYKDFVEAVKSRIKKLKIGDPKDNVDIGPIARRDLLENALRIVRETEKTGAKVEGGKRIGERGFFFYPAIIEEADFSSPVFREETFAPIMPIFRFKTEDEAIEIANKSEFGLGAVIFTKNIGRAKRIAKYIEAGNVAINLQVRSDPKLPFGGVKKSGVGRELSRYGILEFVNIKSFMIKY
jgi:succinate-semialdehyde dehydrogenase/glutarate-semialdehyde dehydrogenase